MQPTILTSEVGQLGPIPLELMPSIFSHLGSYWFCKSGLVCKKWNAFGKEEALWEKVILNELEANNYSSRVFGPREWKTHHKITTDLKYPKKLCIELNKLSPFFPGKTVGETSYVQCKVKKINSCVDLDLLFRNKKNFLEVNKGIINDKEVSSINADWFIVPEKIIPNSTSKTLENQLILIKDPSYKLISIFEISLVAFSQLKATKTLVLDSNPPIFTRAISTSTKKNYNVGNFKEGFGLTVQKFRKEYDLYNTGIIPIKELI